MAKSVTHSKSDEIIVEYYVELIRTSLRNDGEVNLVDIITFSNGWNSLGKNQEVCVHYGDKEYHIWRKK